jgi:GlcNAc-PI de-N-acetylase
MRLHSVSLATAAKCLAIAALVISFSYPVCSQQPIDLNIVAHQDDDILFMNPDILDSVTAGHREVTVYLTAGNLLTDDLYYAMVIPESCR